MSGGWIHLAARFFDVLRARRLRPTEQLEVAALLEGEEEARLFWSQGTADQRHGLQSARRVQAQRPEARRLARAALLHDVGKRHAGLGIMGRTVAAIVERLHLRPAGRVAVYLDHGARGAEDLEGAGSEPLVVQFARHHHRERPPAIDAGDWMVLQDADRVRPWRKALGPGTQGNTMRGP